MTDPIPANVIEAATAAYLSAPDDLNDEDAFWLATPIIARWARRQALEEAQEELIRRDCFTERTLKILDALLAAETEGDQTDG